MTEQVVSTPEAGLGEIHAMLSQISQRLDRLENTLAVVSEAVDQGPGLVATFTDTADDYARKAQDRGIDIDERMGDSIELLERVTRPESLKALSSIVDRLEALEPAVEAASEFPAVGATAADVFDEWATRAQDRGIDIDARAKSMLRLMEKVTEPATMASLEALVDAVGEGPDFVAMVTDIIDAWTVAAVNRGIDFQDRGIAVAQLVEKATEPATLAALGTLVERAPELAPMLDAVGDAPGLVAMVTDILDEWTVAAVNSGVDFQERGIALAKLVEEATEPATLDALGTMLKQVPELAPMMDALAEAPGILAMITDTVDQWAVNAANDGVDFHVRAEALRKFLMNATRPQTVNVLNHLVCRADRLEPLIDILDEAPGLVSMVADMFDGYVVQKVNEGVDMNELVESAVHGAVRLSRFVLSDEFNTMLDSGMLEPEAVRVIGRAGQALAEVSREENSAPGIFGIIGASRRSDVRRTIGFTLRFGERFGQLLTRQLEA